MYDKPLPDLDDALTAAFWEGARSGRLLVQQCRSCGAQRWPPLPVCDRCHAEGAEWVPVSQEGTVWSFAIYHRAFHPGFKADLPYAVAMVENTDGIRFVGQVVGAREALRIGARVRAVFATATPEVTTVAWTVVAEVEA